MKKKVKIVDFEVFPQGRNDDPQGIGYDSDGNPYLVELYRTSISVDYEVVEVVEPLTPHEFQELQKELIN